MTIETHTSPSVQEINGTDLRPDHEFAQPGSYTVTLESIRAARRRNDRDALLGLTLIAALMIGYFVAAAAAPTSPLAGTIARGLAVVIYLSGAASLGWALGMRIVARRRGRR